MLEDRVHICQFVAHRHSDRLVFSVRNVGSSILAFGILLPLSCAQAANYDKNESVLGAPLTSEPVVRQSKVKRPADSTIKVTQVAVDEPPVVQRKSLTSKPNFDFVCSTLQSAAHRNELPVSFLTRLIWQESRFDARAVSPAGARGVAQFMPGTAAYLGLADPFDVSDAINKSAEFLRDLNREFGNLGLAAAAYNAGPGRVHDWLTGAAGLPSETKAYVSIVTGHGADEWRLASPSQWSLMVPEAVPCPQLVKLLAEKPEPISSPGTSSTARASAPSVPVWGLQLTGAASRQEALSAYFEMQKTYKSVLGGHPPLVLRSEAGRGHYWYRVRVAVDSLFRGERLCSDLKAAGGRCLVQRN